MNNNTITPASLGEPVVLPIHNLVLLVICGILILICVFIIIRRRSRPEAKLETKSSRVWTDLNLGRRLSQMVASTSELVMRRVSLSDRRGTFRQLDGEAGKRNPQNAFPSTTEELPEDLDVNYNSSHMDSVILSPVLSHTRSNNLLMNSPGSATSVIQMLPDSEESASDLLDGPSTTRQDLRYTPFNAQHDNGAGGSSSSNLSRSKSDVRQGGSGQYVQFSGGNARELSRHTSMHHPGGSPNIAANKEGQASSKPPPHGYSVVNKSTKINTRVNDNVADLSVNPGYGMSDEDLAVAKLAGSHQQTSQQHLQQPRYTNPRGEGPVYDDIPDAQRVSLAMSTGSGQTVGSQMNADSNQNPTSDPDLILKNAPTLYYDRSEESQEEHGTCEFYDGRPGDGPDDDENGSICYVDTIDDDDTEGGADLYYDKALPQDSKEGGNVASTLSMDEINDRPYAKAAEVRRTIRRSKDTNARPSGKAASTTSPATGSASGAITDASYAPFANPATGPGTETSDEVAYAPINAPGSEQAPLPLPNAPGPALVMGSGTGTVERVSFAPTTTPGSERPPEPFPPKAPAATATEAKQGQKSSKKSSKKKSKKH